MDPALQELMEGHQNDEVEVLVKAQDFRLISEDFRTIARFGDIASGRIARGNIAEVWKKVDCLKAPRLLAIDPLRQSEEDALAEEELFEELEDYQAAPSGGSPNKTTIAVLDWGFDFTHDHLRFADGTSRFLYIWDQGADYDGSNKYGYGRIIPKEKIDKALKSSRPFESLGYHPDAKGHFRSGTHGTHVCGIAARLLPTVPLIGVHLSTGRIHGTNSLGDSVRIAEAIDFVLDRVADRPCCINMSVGSMGGSHTGKSLLEQIFDYVLQRRNGLAICQSAGNYYSSKTHASGFLTQNRSRELQWVVGEADRTPNELEVWYHQEDDVRLRLRPPDASEDFELYMDPAPLLTEGGKSIQATSRGKDIVLPGHGKVGRMYMRKRESTTGLNHIDIFLYPNAPSGAWMLELFGQDIYSGEFHAWIERDGSCRNCQSSFGPEDVSALHTTGTIANSKYGIAVGAYDSYETDVILPPFSSAGRVLDEMRRVKPELIAPGVRIVAARSAAREQQAAAGSALTTKSGTSMAAPHVTAAIATLFEMLPVQIPIDQTRRLLFASTTPVSLEGEPPERYGHGILNLEKLIKMGKQYLSDSAIVPESTEQEQAHTPDSVSEMEAFFRDEADSCGCTEEHEEDVVLPANYDEVYADEAWPANEDFSKKDDAFVLYPESQTVSAPLEFVESGLLAQIGSAFQNGGLALLNSVVELVAAPGQKVEGNLRKGDILIRLGTGGELEQSVILDPTTYHDHNDLFSEQANLPGLFVEVIEQNGSHPTNGSFRRLSNGEGYLPLRQMVIRKQVETAYGHTEEDAVIHSEAIPADDLSWPGATPQQMSFMRAVYTVNLRRSEGRGRFYADIPPEELETIEGRFQARSQTAQACQRMLAAARRDIERERVRVRVGLTSAYRSASHQFRLWNRYFRQQYYPETRTRRRRFRTGEHGGEALAFMARYVRRRIATPGFSNHNRGIAVDLLNQENGSFLRNRSGAADIRNWQGSWFWRWLSRNAETYGFYQNPNINEPWHWEYYGTRGEESYEAPQETNLDYPEYTNIPLDPGNGGRSIGIDSLEIGDIILSTTGQSVSRAIRRFTSSPVSHSILYIGGGQVVEAVGDGVVLRSLQEALHDAILAVAFRYPELPPNKGLQIRDFAGHQIGRSYNYWGIVQQAGFQIDRRAICNRFSDPAVRARCVNWVGRVNLGTGSNDTFFCSELVLAAYRAAGVPLTSTPPHWSSPDDLARLRLSRRLGYVGHLLVR